MQESSVDTAYFILTRTTPPSTMAARDRRIVVMDRWDGRKFDGDPVRERIARKALCVIGLTWSQADSLPYPFHLIAERLRELMPSLGATEITQKHMQVLLHEGESFVSHGRR